MYSERWLRVGVHSRMSKAKKGDERRKQAAQATVLNPTKVSLYLRKLLTDMSARLKHRLKVRDKTDYNYLVNANPACSLLLNRFIFF